LVWVSHLRNEAIAVLTAIAFFFFVFGGIDMIKFEVTVRYANEKSVVCSDVFNIWVDSEHALFLEARMYFKKNYSGCALISMTFKKV
jgi:hypothetical protein